MNDLPVIAAHFAAGRLSYAKIGPTRVATTENESEPAAPARTVPASDPACPLPGCRNRHHTGAEIDAYHHRHRLLRWQTDPDEMITFTIRCQVWGYAPRRTVFDELELQCAPCHRQRHHPKHLTPTQPLDDHHPLPTARYSTN